MPASDARVVIIGCGCAGVTAAIGLVKRGIPAVVIEGGPYPGAENWSGAVYFCENLARPEILGEDLLRQTPLERRIVRRGILASDGRVAPGVAVDCRETFDHCYTTLRPVFDHDLAHKARMLGVEILTGTTATALIRDGDRVRGVLTDRGPLYADVVFLAEGDASNLVTREGLEKIPPAKDGMVRPEFLQGVKEVLQLPETVINERFGLSSGEGAAFEILLRNGVVDGRPVSLNAGAFLYTNRESLSIGLVAPLANLTAFKGDHNLLMEWLKGLPALQPLLADARSVSFGAKLIRGGGYLEMPRLALSGLAVGGAASGIGADFPCPNFTGPATFMGYAFSEAVAEIAESDGDFNQEALEGTYVRRVMESHYVADVRSLEKWPHFVAHAQEFFGRQVEITAGLAHIITAHPGLVARHALAARHLFETLPFGRVLPFIGETYRAKQALGALRGFWKDLPLLLVFWTVNIVLGLVPRRTRTGAKLTSLLFHDGKTPRRSLPWLLRWLRWRFAPGLAEALHHLYVNDGTAVQFKLRSMRMAVLTRMAWWDFILLPLFGAITWFWGAAAAGWFRLTVVLRKMPLKEILATPYFRLRDEARALTDFGRVREAVGHDEKLAAITYESDERTHIHFHAAYDSKGLPDNAGSALFHVCPARVYRAEVDHSLSTSVAVLHENCIRCESCWRGDDLRVDWGRTRGQKLVFEAYTSADVWLAESQEAAARADLDRFEAEPREPEAEEPGGDPVQLAEDAHNEAEAAVARTVSHARAFLELNQRAPALLTGADQGLLADIAGNALGYTGELVSILDRADSACLADRLESMRAWRKLSEIHLATRRYFHVEADFQLLLCQHLPDLFSRTSLSMPPIADCGETLEVQRGILAEEIETRLDRDAVAVSERALAPEGDTRAFLLECARKARRTPVSEPARDTWRDLVMEEVAKKSPSLATLLSRHLAALDVLECLSAKGDRDSTLPEIQAGTSVLGLYESGFGRDEDGCISGTTPCALLGGVETLLVTTPDGVAVIPTGRAGVKTEIIGGIGLRGAGPGRLTIEKVTPDLYFPFTDGAPAADDRAAWDLVAVVRGMAVYLKERALDHTDSRVQFPGLFRDIRGRDGLVKFGAVQDMLAGISQGVEILDGLRGRKGDGFFAWALASDLMGCSPRSLSYLAGQALGGTAVSEEDPVSRFYRDASALSRMPIDVSSVLAATGLAVASGAESGSAALPGLAGQVEDLLEGGDWPELVIRHTEPLRSRLRELNDALASAEDASGRALAWDLGRLACQATGVRVLAMRVAQDLDSGHADEVLIPCLEAFARRIEGRAARVAMRVDDAAEVAGLGRVALTGPSIEEPCGATGASYADFLAQDLQCDSGDTFLRTGNATELCLTPELIEADDELREFDQQAKEVYASNFERKDFGGKRYTRLIEERHHIPLEDVKFLLDRGALRTVIPEAYLGQGLKKAAYYLECVRMLRHADASHALLVMGSTSIGTTPLQIGLEQDLPAARKALANLLDHPEAVDAIRQEIEQILRISGTPQVLQVGKQMKALAGTVKKTFQKAKATKLVFQGFLRAFMKAGMAGMRKDLRNFVSGLEKSLTALDGWEERLSAELATLPAREAAHTFYLKLISTGRISAFALTEPSAGSDTARIRTRARRVEVPAQRDPRGFYTFVPEGGHERRNLFTMESLEFRDGAMVFVGPDGNATPVECRDFAYGGDEPEKERYVVIGEKRVDIDDMGRVEPKGEEYVYPYFCVNGAKMWITNGSVAGVMILYALTERGPTAFMLDAHAEGLAVGSDEEKMGQRGSATNELALQDVRIPVDCLIGIEGRGQENALETLNVGRTGLATTSVGFMQDVLVDMRAGLAESDISDYQCYQAGRIALDLVSSESLAWQVVGRFDHKGTRGIRMESAIAKARGSEALHRVISRAEQALPAEYALDCHELEKRRRDARVLTIYEGTNEIQRFLLLRDLVEALDLDRMETTENAADTRAMLDAHRRRIVEATLAVRKELGSRAWQSAHLQPRLFSLVQAAMDVAAVSAAVHRADVAGRLIPEGAESARLRFLETASRLLAADLSRQEVTLMANLQKEGQRVHDGRDPVTQEICDRALLRHEAGQARTEQPVRGSFSKTLQVAVVIEPQPVLAPRPRVSGGSLREPLNVLGAGDRAALRQALALREHGEVVITCIGIGGITGVDVMEEALALGADHAFLLNTCGRNIPATMVAEELADLLRTREALEETRVDLVLGHEQRAGVLLPLARRMDLEPLSGVHDVGMTESDGRVMLRAAFGGPVGVLDLPAPALCMVSQQVGEPEFRFNLDGWRRVRRQQVSVIDFTPRDDHLAKLSTADQGAVQEAGGGDGSNLSQEELAKTFVAEAGLAPGSDTRESFAGSLENGGIGDFLHGIDALAVVEADQTGECRPGTSAAIRSAALVAKTSTGQVAALVLVETAEEPAIRAAVGEVCGAIEGLRIAVLAHGDLATLSTARRGALVEALIEEFAGSVFFAWTLRYPGLLAGEGRVLQREESSLIRSVDSVMAEHDRLVFGGPAHDGKLRFSIERPIGAGALSVVTGLTVETNGQYANDGGESPRSVTLLDSGQLPKDSDPLTLALRAAGSQIGVASLAEAEFIIDVGYGVGSRDGIEEVIEPLKVGLEAAGVRSVHLGATRKVTLDLGILPESCQIGQTGVSVNPKVMLAIGVSGAPQHIDWVGERTVIFAFNKDPEAPLMLWNRSHPKPLVFPVLGDLFKEVPRFLVALQESLASA